MVRITDTAYEHLSRKYYEADLLRVGFVWYEEPVYEPQPFTNYSLRAWPVPSRTDSENLVKHWSSVYGINWERARWTIECESGFNAAAKNKTSSAAGLWQFIRGTFNSTFSRMGLGQSLAVPEGSDPYTEYVWNAEVNAQMGAWLAANDSFSHWECGSFSPT